jgi:hypothetical protein
LIKASPRADAAGGNEPSVLYYRDYRLYLATPFLSDLARQAQIALIRELGLTPKARAELRASGAKAAFDLASATAGGAEEAEKPGAKDTAKHGPKQNPAANPYGTWS